MKLRILCLLTALTVLLGMTGCGAADEPTVGEESLYGSVMEEDDTEDISASEKPSDSEEEVPEPDASSASEAGASDDDSEYVEYWFRTKKLRDQHYEKHGIEMGFDNADDYRRAASDVVNDPDALHKIEQEDGDDVYYLEETNEFVVVSTDGYLRTYFKPDKGKAYYDKQ